MLPGGKDMKSYALISATLLLFAAPAGAQDTSMSFFVTSANPGQGADLGGLEGADAYCAQLAEAAGVTGKTWRAYLSDMAGGIAARDRIGAGPWFNAYGTNIVPTCTPTCVDALHTDGISASLIVDENGTHVEWAIEHDIWTGSNPDGTPSGQDCLGWTSSSIDELGLVGHADGMQGLPNDSLWNSAHPSGCDSFSLICTRGRGQIYCFAID
jgi:hypothetical protein